jgi:threonine synthase
MAKIKSAFSGLRCLDCGEITHGHVLTQVCPHCSSEWLHAEYHLENLELLLNNFKERPFNLWRYSELLPSSNVQPNLKLDEGGTPLVRAESLGAMLGLNELYIKDERQGPTASFKDRQAAVTIAALQSEGRKEAVVCSTGNVAIAYSAQCARAGIRLWAFLTSLVPAEKMHEVAIYGTQIVKVTGTYDQAKQLAAKFAEDRGFFFDRGARNVPSIEAMKTIAFEICEQLPVYIPPQATLLNSPDWYIQSVSGGMGPLGVYKGFQEFRDAGLCSSVPKLGVIQTEGCAPMVRSWKAGKVTADPVTVPRTYITTLTTGDPGRSYTELREIMIEDSGGVMESVSDEEAFRAIHLLAQMEGISMEPAAAVAFAGLLKLVKSGVIQKDQVVVVNCSGHTKPAEKTLLRDDWAQVLDLERIHSEAPQEGLYAALANLDQENIRRVLIVDDQADARRLLRRILAAQGEFLVEEAESGTSALVCAEANPPDLIVLDLMMPEMDGFTLLDRLKSHESTRNVPVIVVTAKELSSSEIGHLKRQNARLMQKGDFLTDDLLEEIDKALKDPDQKN